MNFTFSGNSDRHTIVSHTFEAPIIARFIRVYPQTWNGIVAVRWGVYGCNGYWLEPRDGYLYFVGVASLSWDAAREECVNSYLSLASITNSSENAFIENELSQNGELWLGLNHKDGNCGCYGVAEDICKSCRNSWTWHDDTSMLYHAWREGEPGESEMCGRLTESGWAGDPCNAKYRFVCKAHLCDFIACGYGSCIVVNEGASCKCPPGISGENCETNIDECASNPCLNGECHDGINDYTCRCDSGYTGAECETDINECASYPCENGGSCEDDVAKFVCHCSTGFTGTMCETDIDDCLSARCGENSICIDGISDYTCQCNQGFTGEMCESDVNECVSLPCQNDGSCDDEEARFSCRCAPGFTGTLCEIDVDECASNPCSDTAHCVDAIDSYTCDCFDGYTGDTCHSQIDECISQPCGHHGVCVDFVNAFECICDDKFSGKLCENEETPEGLPDSMRRKDLVTALIAGSILAIICLVVLGIFVFLELRDKERAKRISEEPRVNDSALNKDAPEIDENRL